MSGNVDQ